MDKARHVSFSCRRASRAHSSVVYDLVGVPPDQATLERFAANPTKEEYERIVEQLLADKRFGERMARGWLDVVRYAETNSFERDGEKPNAYKYRDYVIDSFNKDKPYDQFLREQIEGGRATCA